MKRNNYQSATNAAKRRANNWLLKYRQLDDLIRSHEQDAEDAITDIRNRMAFVTAPLRKQQKDFKARLEGYYRKHRQPNSRCLDLQDGRVGERVVTRVEIPKKAVDRVPKKALSIKKRVNKTALKALGEKAVIAAGGKIVRPLRFYVSPTIEDAEK